MGIFDEHRDVAAYVRDLCKGAKTAARCIAQAEGERKNELLYAIADALVAHSGDIIEANRADLCDADKNGVAKNMLDRLMLDEKRVYAIAEAVRDVARLEDPCGSGERNVRPNGLVISKTRVPLGVVAIIYESRPNVTVDAAALCIKSGNAVVLRGGKESIRSNIAICAVMRGECKRLGFDENICSLVEDTSREGSAALMGARGLVDVLIPRGGRGLIRSVVENATVPVIETGAGNCHIYIDSPCDLDMAVSVAVNAKCSRPSVCNAVETLLVHRDAADSFLPAFYEATRACSLEIRGDERTRAILSFASAATEEDWETEYNDYIAAVKVVDDISEAIEHIAKYSTGHSESIITNDIAHAHRFEREVDAAAVYVNASTRFTDGGEFGLGAEMGISTQKLHARGPMGLRELTTTKYIVEGDGQIR